MDFSKIHHSQSQTVHISIMVYIKMETGGYKNSSCRSPRWFYADDLDDA